MVVQFVIRPSRLNVANHGRGCFLYIRKMVAFSLMTAASHSRNSSGDDALDVVARIITFGCFLISSMWVLPIS